MNHISNRLRKAVKRQNAETYLLITLLSFAASVVLTRLFLELTGYPQLGGGGLHVAHVLWGGLLLFIAALLPLILTNRWAFTFSAMLAGAGVGLFIDEVGKFITQNNNYFYPAAAPIIYAFFLLTVLLYLQVRRPSMKEPRSELYNALDAMEEILDNDLSSDERDALKIQLQAAASKPDPPNLNLLANTLLKYLDDPALQLSDMPPDLLERLLSRIEAIEKKYITPRLLRAILIGGLGGLGLVSFYNVVQFSQAHFMPEIRVTSAASPYWFVASIILEGFVALLLLCAAILLTVRHVRKGLALSYYGLLLSLTTVNLLVFFFHQFSTIIPAMIQFGLLMGVIYYRKNYIKPGI